MKLSRILLTSLLSVLLSALSIPTHAAPINTLNYTESDTKFTWVFSWERVIQPAFTVPSIAHSKWDPMVQVRPLNELHTQFLFNFMAQHLVKGDLDDNAEKGTQFKGSFNTVSPQSGEPEFPNLAVNQLPVTNALTPIFGAPVGHAPHFDNYTLAYKSPAQDGPVEFTFMGEHSPSAIPEPATLLLFGTTAAGLGLARWRQRRRKQR
jgi:PEP-CTERM motif